MGNIAETGNSIVEISKKIKQDIEESKGRSQWLDYGFMIAVIGLLLTILVYFNGRIDGIYEILLPIYQALPLPK